MAGGWGAGTGRITAQIDQSSVYRLKMDGPEAWAGSIRRGGMAGSGGRGEG